MGKSRVVIATVVATLASASVLAAVAEWKPEKPIEIIVGTGVGGGQDKSARTVQRILQEKKLVEQPVTVVNKPGGGGAVGYTYLNQHAGQGHILYVGNPTLLTNHIAGRSPVNYTHVTPLAILLSESVAVTVKAVHDAPGTQVAPGRLLVELEIPREAGA